MRAAPRRLFLKTGTTTIGGDCRSFTPSVFDKHTLADELARIAADLRRTDDAEIISFRLETRHRIYHGSTPTRVQIELVRNALSEEEGDGAHD